MQDLIRGASSQRFTLEAATIPEDICNYVGRRGARPAVSLRRILPLVSVAVLALALAAFAASAADRTPALDDFGPAPTFALTDQDGNPVTSEQLRGQVALADFIYTNCTDICPLLTGRMKQVQDRLQQAGLLDRGVQLVSFTVDPAHDTPPVLQAYAERYRADTRTWRFLTGSEEVMVPLVEQGFYLGIIPIPPPASAEPGATPGDFAHAGRFVLIDRSWRIRHYYDAQNLDPARVTADIRSLLP
jgi:protein SCO1